jgi:5-methylcytosine-specific restriction endonuclease McrBC regulatory subunit McrC
MEPNRTWDNNCHSYQLIESESNDLACLTGKTIKHLADEYPNLLVFPTNLSETKDKIGDQQMVSIDKENKLGTGNIMGFIGVNETQLTISSRFYPSGDDYFLHYMLQKVFSLNLFDFKFNTHKENIWDILLIYMFPYYLKKATNQGLYKEYVRKDYNDANVKGTINVARHLKENLPFRGTISYRTREHTNDNNVTQLIRHTQEYIKGRSFGSILSNDKGTKDAVNLIAQNTTSYNKMLRTKVIQNNIRSLNHPFYTEYETLRKICLQILSREGLSLGKKDNKAYGILFDGAWLWEEYLNTILRELDFEHPENKNKKGGIYLLQKNGGLRYPDFYSKDKTIVLDAKYKRSEGWNPNGENNSDIYQVITYLHCLKSQIGGFIFPKEKETKKELIGELNGVGGLLYKLTLGIPQEGKGFKEFINKIFKEEQLIKEMIKHIMPFCHERHYC